VAVDDHTFRIDFARKDKLIMPVTVSPMCLIFNSELAKKHATAADPWAIDWLKSNTAGGGGYNVMSRMGDDEIIFVRHDKWKSGPLPKIERVIWRVVPSVSTRRALLERGDADMSSDLPPKDVSELAANEKLRLVSNPIQSSAVYLSMQVKMPPFENPKVRQAIAYAVPYEKIMDVALYHSGRPLFGGPAKVTLPDWPQPGPYRTDLAKAKQLLTEAGFPNGFETTLSFNLGAAVTNEPMCVLIQESLAQIGVKATLDKIAGANWGAAYVSKKLPFLINVYGGWYDYPDVYFYWAYHGLNNVFNTASYQNPAMDKIIDMARSEDDPTKYNQDVVEFVQLAFDDLPEVPLYQPYLNVAMQKGITGYRYWFHRQDDYRLLQKA
jgi:peptide/nickel transport system substrate-binding protein